MSHQELLLESPCAFQCRQLCGQNLLPAGVWVQAPGSLFVIRTFADGAVVPEQTLPTPIAQHSWPALSSVLTGCSLFNCEDCWGFFAEEFGHGEVQMSPKHRGIAEDDRPKGSPWAACVCCDLCQTSFLPLDIQSSSREMAKKSMGLWPAAETSPVEQMWGETLTADPKKHPRETGEHGPGRYRAIRVTWPKNAIYG